MNAHCVRKRPVRVGSALSIRSIELAAIVLMIACCAAAAGFAVRCGLSGLARLEPRATGRIVLLPWIALAGSSAGLAAAASRAHLAGQVQPADLLWIFLGALFMAAAWVDARTYWAPDELVLPCCIIAGSVGLSDREGCWWLAGAALGAAVWIAARIAWQLQGRFRTGFPPPPDLVALAMPLLLFGSDIRAVFACLACVPALAAIGLYRMRFPPACGPPAPAFYRRGGGGAVPFLGIALPANLIAGLVH